MSRTIEGGELGLIVIPFIAKKTENNNLDGMEDSILNPDDIVIESTLCARVLALNLYPDPENEDQLDIYRERALDAAHFAAALMGGDREARSRFDQWKALQMVKR